MKKNFSILTVLFFLTTYFNPAPVFAAHSINQQLKALQPEISAEQPAEVQPAPLKNLDAFEKISPLSPPTPVKAAAEQRAGIQVRENHPPLTLNGQALENNRTINFSNGYQIGDAHLDGAGSIRREGNHVIISFKKKSSASVSGSFVFETEGKPVELAITSKGDLDFQNFTLRENVRFTVQAREINLSNILLKGSSEPSPPTGGHPLRGNAPATFHAERIIISNFSTDDPDIENGEKPRPVVFDAPEIHVEKIIDVASMTFKGNVWLKGATSLLSIELSVEGNINGEQNLSIDAGKFSVKSIGNLTPLQSLDAQGIYCSFGCPVGVFVFGGSVTTKGAQKYHAPTFQDSPSFFSFSGNLRSLAFGSIIVSGFVTFTRNKTLVQIAGNAGDSIQLIHGPNWGGYVRGKVLTIDAGNGDVILGGYQYPEFFDHIPSINLRRFRIHAKNILFGFLNNLTYPSHWTPIERI